MKSLTILTPGVDESVSRDCHCMLNRFFWQKDRFEECSGPGASEFGRAQATSLGSGSTKSWTDGETVVTLWSDGEGYRIAIRLQDGVRDVEVGMEMPRTLTFLRDRDALAKLAWDVKSRMGTRRLMEDPRTIASLARAEGLVAALSLQASQSIGDLGGGVPATIRLPSPLQPKGSDPVLAIRDGRELVPTSAFRSLMRTRIPSTLRIREGRKPNAVFLEAETREADPCARDAMETLRIGVAASPHLPHDHPPLVEWRPIQRKERP